VPSSLDIARDPFHEQGARVLRWSARVLGARFEFTSNSRELLSVAQEAFARVPQHRWPRSGARGTLRVDLKHVRDGASPTRATPPKPMLSSGAGLLCAHVDALNFMVADLRAARALIQVGDSMLSHRRLLRYELIEFAAITLATRAQGLVSLHAGCVGARGRGILLLGSSGSGKSTLALHAALGGLDFLAEDSVFVQPATLRATGLSAYVHARDDALPLIGDRHVRRSVRLAPRIQRRSGVRKREIDLRRAPALLAPKPLRIVAAVVLSTRRARRGAGLVPLTNKQLRRVLRTEQSYAVARPGWQEFERRVLHVGGFRLDRVPPADGVSRLRELLEDRAA
jgi:hypothetical protein